VAGSPFATGSGSQQFPTPGTNAAGNSDWLLVLDGNGGLAVTPSGIPANVIATNVYSTQVNMVWTASTDKAVVAGYRIFHNGTQVGTSTAILFSDNGLMQDSTYIYSVASYGSEGNVSGQSAPVSATTTSAPPPPAIPAFVQVNSTSPQTAQKTVALHYAQAQNSGDMNVVVIGFSTTAATINAINDSIGNTYALAAALTRGGSMYQAIYYARNIKSAPAARQHGYGYVFSGSPIHGHTHNRV
jgi:chitodextrinase